ncbi:hypothetical protein [uncultured Marinococcus sp.]|uniref:hypothetical protein n=1 Tax=uncultured Marinococcus sp. TaxID=487012 RepID=UPI0026136577|nr:hypothetical protein [uncultured Marinococcus sp.]
MEIKVRELSPIVVQTIDERAKKRGLSRQHYLKELIENYVMQKELNETDQAYKALIEKNTEALNQFSEQMQRQNEWLASMSDDMDAVREEG